MAFRDTLQFFLAPNGLVQPAPQNPSDWGRLIDTRSDDTTLCALAPWLGIESGRFSPTYFDSYTANTCRTTTLTVVPYRDQPSVRFAGRNDASGVVHFTNPAGARVASIERPPTRDVFGCDGRLRAPGSDLGAIARSLCAALHRSAPGYLDTQPTYNPAEFYTRTITDHYSRKITAQMVDGKACGFAFDDVGNFESLVHDPDPRSARDPHFVLIRQGCWSRTVQRQVPGVDCSREFTNNCSATNLQVLAP